MPPYYLHIILLTCWLLFLYQAVKEAYWGYGLWALAFIALHGGAAAYLVLMGDT